MHLYHMIIERVAGMIIAVTVRRHTIMAALFYSELQTIGIILNTRLSFTVVWQNLLHIFTNILMYIITNMIVITILICNGEFVLG